MSKSLIGKLHSSSPFPSHAERARDRELKREALLQAAVRMFNERGFHSTSLEDVAASLGVTKPVIYHYLGNKDQVLFACVRVGLHQLHEATAGAAGRGNGLQQLEIALLGYAATTMSEFGRCVIRTPDDALSPESRREFRRLKSQIDHTIRALIANGIDDGSLRPVDVRLTAFAFAGALNWCAAWYDPAGPQTPAQIAADMVSGLIGGIRP